MNHIHIDFARKGVIFINTKQTFYIKPNRFFLKTYLDTPYPTELTLSMDFGETYLLTMWISVLI